MKSFFASLAGGTPTGGDPTDPQGPVIDPWAVFGGGGQDWGANMYSEPAIPDVMNTMGDEHRMNLFSLLIGHALRSGLLR